MSAIGIEERIRRVIARTFNVSEDGVTAQTAMGNPPAWDSFGHMQLVAALEEEFKLTFPSYKLAELTSVEAIATTVAEQLAS